MKNLSVRIKVLLLAAIMLVITCIVAAVGIFSNHQSKQAVDDMYNYNLMTTQKHWPNVEFRTTREQGQKFE